MPAPDRTYLRGYSERLTLVEAQAVGLEEVLAVELPASVETRDDHEAGAVERLEPHDEGEGGARTLLKVPLLALVVVVDDALRVGQLLAEHPNLVCTDDTRALRYLTELNRL